MNLTNLKASKRTREGVARAVKLVGCDEAALRAVMRVESAKRGWDSKGRLTALFEPHRFYLELSARPDALAAAQAQGLAYPHWGEKPYPKDNYPRILAAMKIDEEAALRATSWGLPQILGSNCKLCGYGTAAEMVADFLTGEDSQLLAMARFIDGSGLSGRLRAHDWAGFARGYNGKRFKENGYDVALAKAYAAEVKADDAADNTKAGAVVVAGGGLIAGMLNAIPHVPPGLVAIVAILSGSAIYRYAQARRKAADEALPPVVGEVAQEPEIEPSASPASPLPLDGLRAARARLDAAQQEMMAAEIAFHAEAAKAQQFIDAMKALVPAADAANNGEQQQ